MRAQLNDSVFDGSSIIHLTNRAHIQTDEFTTITEAQRDRLCRWRISGDGSSILQVGQRQQDQRWHLLKAFAVTQSLAGSLCSLVLKTVFFLPVKKHEERNLNTIEVESFHGQLYLFKQSYACLLIIVKIVRATSSTSSWSFQSIHPHSSYRSVFGSLSLFIFIFFIFYFIFYIRLALNWFEATFKEKLATKVITELHHGFDQQTSTGRQSPAPKSHAHTPWFQNRRSSLSQCRLSMKHFLITHFALIHSVLCLLGPPVFCKPSFLTSANHHWLWT